MSTKLAVPQFFKEKSYERYKAEIEIWSDATELKPEKQGSVVALSLPEEDQSQIRDKVFTDLTKAELGSATGLQKLLDYLDKHFGKDDLSDTFEKYDEFEKCKRTSDQKIEEYIVDFEAKYSKVAKKDMKLPACVLAFKLINSAGLLSHEKNACVIRFRL